MILLLVPVVYSAQAQDPVQETVNRIFEQSLIHQQAYENLRVLTSQTAGRISGTAAAAAAVELTRQMLLDLKPDTVWLQPVMVPRWVRGSREQARIISAKYGDIPVQVTALGTSPGTAEAGISARVVEVKSLKELEALGRKGVEGKIVFFNRPMDPLKINTFAAYGGAVDQRSRGPALAARFGAVAAVVRSMTTRLDDVPHTGATRFDDQLIPAAAISTLGAEKLHLLLSRDPGLKFYLKMNCRNEPEVLSYNVVSEIRGSEFPGQIITVGGHLDAWDTGEGAHDDGAGCVQAIEMIRIFRTLGLKPRHTLRAVMFMDEEISQSGGKAYADSALHHGEKHVLAFESDRGGFLPRGVGVNASNPQIQEKLLALVRYFEPWNIREFSPGGGGTDIGPLRSQGTIMSGLIPDSQRYFDVHHSASDVIGAVNPRELQLGAATMAAFIWLADQMDLEEE